MFQLFRVHVVVVVDLKLPELDERVHRRLDVAVERDVAGGSLGNA
ncbi:hypothetical protein [Streptomyces sp. CS014]|nr:hypothetical protein [Streptomyces sp. CS014]